MKRMLALLMTLMLLLGLCSCGAGSSAGGDTAASSSGGASNEMNSTDSGWDNGSTQDAPQESEGQSSASVYQDAKLIRRAYLQIQTETFDQAVEALEKMVQEGVRRLLPERQRRGREPAQPERFSVGQLYHPPAPGAV